MGFIPIVLRFASVGIGSGRRCRLSDADLLKCGEFSAKLEQSQLGKSNAGTMTSPIRRIIIVDDHDAIRRGIRQLVETKPYYQVAGEAKDGRSALELAKQTRPDIAIVDYSVP